MFRITLCAPSSRPASLQVPAFLAAGRVLQLALVGLDVGCRDLGCAESHESGQAELSLAISHVLVLAWKWHDID